MPTPINQNPEQLARDKIDIMLINAGWVVQSKKQVNLTASKGVADYVLFVDRQPVGIIEAKREEGQHLLQVAEQATKYATSKLKYLNNDPLPFIYESTGSLTHFTDYRDPKPRARIVFVFHQPETMARWLSKPNTLRGRLSQTPKLDPTGLRFAQIKAIENLEYSFQPNDDNRKFTELYNVQRLTSSYIASDSQVCISTIQRMYAILKGEELDENSEQDNPNESSWSQQQGKKEPLPVIYSPKIPIEQFDFIVIDECHRSIYNLWKQVLDYFDAFLIGLTATPDKRTFGFFNENVVSEYTYEESVLDGVNVPYEVYTIETEISKKGETIKAGWFVDRRDKITRKKRWQQEDEDTTYTPNQLDKKVVNPSQIRLIIREYKRALKQEIYPNRFTEDGEYEVPKTLVFAKTDSHADDIIKIIHEEFDEGNEFCKKVTYKISEDPKLVLNRFRNSYYPRIASVYPQKSLCRGTA